MTGIVPVKPVIVNKIICNNKNKLNIGKLEEEKINQGVDILKQHCRKTNYTNLLKSAKCSKV